MLTSPYQISIVAPPCVAFIYSISVQCFLAGWHECRWTFHAASISLRLALLIVCIGIFLAMGEINSASTMNADDFMKSFVAPAIISPILSSFLVHRTRKKYITGPKPSLEKTAVGKVIMITGSNTGIGKETARQLLAAGATVIMACRSESRAKAAMNDILSTVHFKCEASNESTTLLSPPKERLLFLKCDVSDYDSVRSSVEDFEKMNLPLDVLINNAGIMMGNRNSNKHGHELTMACNHLGHFLLTHLLLPKLQRAKDGRIVVVTSSTYCLADSGIDLEDLNCERRKYTMFSQYAQSKLANILMGRELAKRELRRTAAEMNVKNVDTSSIDTKKKSENQRPVAVYMVHPGLVRTDVVRNMPWYLKYPNMIFSMVLVTLQKSPEAGAYTNVFCATSNTLDGKSGDYFSNSHVCDINEFAKDEKKARALWDLSCELVGIKN